MTDRKKVQKTGRAERHRQRAQALRERKRLRKERAKIHAAMTEAKRMKRSKRKGCADVERNMVELGFTRATERGDVLEKYARVGDTR